MLENIEKSKWSEYNLRFFALGGLGEVGSNCYVFESEEDIIIVDCGVKFVNNDPLVSGSIPNFTYLVDNKKKIKGLFITHAHDDHISGVFFLLNLIPNIPIFGSEFTSSLAREKTKISPQKKWNIFRNDTIIRLGSFRISFFQVTHSIPGSFGLVIEYLPKNFRAVITGDFKFDWSNIGEKFDLFRLTEETRKGVDLLVSESTNSEIEGATPSETKVIQRLENIVSSSSGRVIITSFSSNVYRLKKIMEIAKKTNRLLVLLGTSLLRSMKAIRGSSLWELDSSLFLKATDIAKTLPEKLIIFCTGSQGEERSVLSRLASNSYPGWKIDKRDSIIWTSSPIKDNKTNVEIVNNKLFASGATIYENKPTDLLHVSGHACQEDLKLLLTLVKPRFFFPCHGEFTMLKKHAQLAQDIGIPAKSVFVCKNGDIIAYNKEKNFVLTEEKIEANPTFVSGEKIVSQEEIRENFELKKAIRNGGLFVIFLFSSNKKKTEEQQNRKKIITSNGAKSEIEVIFYTYGCLRMQKNKQLIDDWKKKLKTHLTDIVLANSGSSNNKQGVENATKEYVQDVLFFSWENNNVPFIKIINFFS